MCICRLWTLTLEINMYHSFYMFNINLVDCVFFHSSSVYHSEESENQRGCILTRTQKQKHSSDVVFLITSFIAVQWRVVYLHVIGYSYLRGKLLAAFPSKPLAGPPLSVVKAMTEFSYMPRDLRLLTISPIASSRDDTMP